ncbi:hypothetical protein GCM10010404_44880 [Nonomuraea africana]
MAGREARGRHGAFFAVPEPATSALSCLCTEVHRGSLLRASALTAARFHRGSVFVEPLHTTEAGSPGARFHEAREARLQEARTGPGFHGVRLHGRLRTGGFGPFAGRSVRLCAGGPAARSRRPGAESRDIRAACRECWDSEPVSAQGLRSV